MTEYTSTVKFKGQDGKVVPRFYTQSIDETVGGVGSLFATALANHNSLIAALILNTQALISEHSLSIQVDTDSANGSGNVFENAQLVCDLIDPDNPDDVVNIFVPAPVDGMFMGSAGKAYNQVDVNDANLQTLIGEFEDNFRWSDGELIDPAVGTNGLLGGFRMVSALKLPK